MNDNINLGGPSLVAFLDRIGLPPVVLPIVTGLPPRALTYLLFERLPHGATFDAATGRIGGRAVEPGSHRVWISATDSTGGDGDCRNHHRRDLKRDIGADEPRCPLSNAF